MMMHKYQLPPLKAEEYAAIVEALHYVRRRSSNEEFTTAAKHALDRTDEATVVKVEAYDERL
jgi:hypothetical protein